jgi:integrase
MIKRRCAAAGLSASICSHSFRPSALTMRLESGGDIRAAQLIAGHADIRTTLLYDRRSRRMQRPEVERVQL